MAKEVTVIPATRFTKAKGTPNKSTDHKLRVAAYCRVSTEQEEQENSFKNQVEYYTRYISENPRYELAGIYADEGISGTNTKKREEFKRMIADCEANKIDVVITKSISRFARNTQDCLENYRKLKSLGVTVIFEKENINSADKFCFFLVNHKPASVVFIKSHEIICAEMWNSLLKFAANSPFSVFRNISRLVLCKRGKNR